MSTIKNCPLIYISTSEIYGHRDEKMYLSEKDDKFYGEFTVRNEYSMSKLAEIIITNYSKIDSDFKFQIIRPLT